MKIRCRFAPSPTGFLHVGNIRTAIINYLFTKKLGGNFFLRLDDTDKSRVTEEYRKEILNDFKFLNIDYDKLIKQSDRLEIYEESKKKLIEQGRIYQCFETKEELHYQRKIQIKSGQRPIYNRSALELTKKKKFEYEQRGVKPYYRFLLRDQETAWEDNIKGHIIFDGRHFSDPVIAREDNIPTYAFSSVVDDIDLNITHVIRGEDHITNTAVQIQIFQSLGIEIPNFSHLALVKVNEGKISKRIGGFDIKSLREFEPLSLITLLSTIGTSKGTRIFHDISEIIEQFNLKDFSKSVTKYNIDDLILINQKILQNKTLTKLKKENNNIEYTKDFWEIIKYNITFLKDSEEWLRIIKNSDFKYLKFSEEERKFLNLCKTCLTKEIKQENDYEKWIENIKNKTSKKGKDLFMPLRIALTGKKDGPLLKDLFYLISYKNIVFRLSF